MIGDEIAVALELEALFGAGIAQARFEQGGDDLLRLRIEVVEEITFQVRGVAFAPGKINVYANDWRVQPTDTRGGA